MERAAIAVIIPNWNRPGDTITCLRSLAAGSYAGWHAIVVDNASTDDSVAAIGAAFPAAEILVNEQNVGFAGGVNVGIARARAAGFPYLLLLNNDTQVAPDALGALLTVAESDPRAGILSPLIYYADGARIWFAGAYRRRRLPGISLPWYRRHHSFLPRPFSIDYATGCAMLIRTELVEQVGGLDSGYFMYWEDLDLCERARRAGWRLLLVPSATVNHRVSASTGENAPAKWYYLAYYMPTFYRRYYRRPVAAMLSYAAWILARETVRGNWRVIGPYLTGFRDGFFAQKRGL
jgi:GT2 family glycosyltransferase